MSSKDIYYSYDIETGELVSKTRFNDNGTIDRWNHINEPAYSHDKYSSKEKFAFDDEGDIYSRPFGADPNRIWDDRNGVMGKK